MSCCSFHCSTGQSFLPSARQCLSPPKHLIFRLSEVGAVNDGGWRVQTSRQGWAAARQKSRRLEFPSISSRSDFSAVSNWGGFLFVIHSEPSHSAWMRILVGVFQWVFRFNEFASFALMQNCDCHYILRPQYPSEWLYLNKLSVSLTWCEKHFFFSILELISLWFLSLIGHHWCVFWYLYSTQVTLVDANDFVTKWAN